MTNGKQMMSWSLRIQEEDYRHDFERYGNKVTSIGFHEWDVDGEGKIAIYKLGPEKSGGVYRTEVDANGDPIYWTDATTYDRYQGSLWPDYIEPDMARWPHIEYYMQMVMFGPETVSRLLDSTVNQDNFIANLKQVVTLFRTDQAGNDLGYSGLEIDCEGSWSDDKWDSRTGDDVKYINLLKRIKNEVIIDANPDFKLRINGHAMWGAGVPDYYRFHNFKLFADSVDENGDPLCDEVQIMTYDFSWAGSSPGPSTPLWWMRDVAEWVQECFDPGFNPDARCTIENVYLGGAGYGRRWPIFSADTYGSSVTYRNMVDWQNGYYIHYLGSGEMADQDFISQNGYNDPNSDNQILFQHQYDYFRARNLKMDKSMGNTTVRMSQYNGIEYATAYSKMQHIEVSGVYDLAGEMGISEPTHNITDPNWGDPKRGETVTLELEGIRHTFQGYQTERVPYVPATTSDGTEVCAKSSQPETVLEYTVNVPTTGTYKIGAVVSFPFYGFTKLGGKVNGSTAFTIGGTIPEYYPMMFDAVHVWDMGSMSLNAGDNTITIEGVNSMHGTIIFGFIVGDVIESEVIGGNARAKSTVNPYKKRDGTDAKMPTNLTLNSEVLQQSPRPVIMWEDYFSQFLDDAWVQGDNYTEDQKTIQNSGLQSTTYYKWAGEKMDMGGGTMEQRDADGTLTGCYTMRDTGFSQGYWGVIQDENGTTCVHFDPTDSKNNGVTSGQLVLNYTYQMENISAEVQFKAESGKRAGIRFASTGPGDGYIFLFDYDTQSVMIVQEVDGVTTNTIASASMGDRSIPHGDRAQMKILVNDGVCRATIGGLNLMGDVALTMQPGGIGFYATNCDAYLYMMSIGSTEKWETLERFSLIMDGQEIPMGELSRTGITRDQYGFLEYSGLNEVNTRDSGQSIDLDYVFFPKVIPSWVDKKDIQIKFVDAGLWFKMLYIGDADGMSISYVGDEQSFNKAMNIAVYDYNCKGIGLWVLGQADPRIYETLPDVVPWYE